MVEYKNFIGDFFLNKDIHLQCDCLFGLDVVGKVVKYSLEGSEIIYSILSNEKIINVGENTPGLKIKIL